MRWLAVGWACLGLACTPGVPAREALSAPGLVVTAVVEGPGGSDAPPRMQLTFEDGTPLGRTAIAYVARWGSGGAIVDPDRRLYEVWPGGTRMLAERATGALAVSLDGERLAYVTETHALGSLHLHDGHHPRLVAEGFASIGTIRLSGGDVVFVGARPGGIAGVWTGRADEAPRCHTNCDLRAGEPFLDRFVPPPTDPRTVALGDHVVSWIDPGGTAREAAR